MKIIRDEVFKSSYDDLDIHYDVYEPGENNNGILIQAFHGMAENKERYERFGTYLAERGFTFVISAHRGHLGAVKNEADFGYMGRDGLNKARDDGYTLTKLMKERYHPTKYVLFGHSMGSIIARLYFQRYADELDAMIVCGCVANNKAAKAGRMFAGLVALLRGGRYKSKMLDNASFGAYNERTDKRTNFDWLSYNTKNVDDYIKNSACGFTFSAQSFKDLTGGIVDIYSEYPKPLKNSKCHVFFISGEDDPCGGYGNGVIEAVDHMKSQGVEDVSYKLYTNMRHEILNEDDWTSVADDVISFLNSKLV